MKNTLLPALVAVLLTANSADAFTAIYRNFNDAGGEARLIVRSDNTPPPANSGSVALGTFATLTDAQITTLGAPGLATLLADFVSFANSVNNPKPTGDGDAFNIPGAYSGVLTANVNAGDQFAGKSVYTFIGNGASLAGSTQIAIVKDNDTFAEGPTANANIFIYEATSLTLVGETGPVQPAPDLGGSFATLRLVAVPEPSVGLLGLLSVFGFLRRRR